MQFYTSKSSPSPEKTQTASLAPLIYKNYLKNIECFYTPSHSSWSTHEKNPLTSVFLRALVRGGDGDGVKHAAVLPGVVGVADTLHLVTARLRAGEDVVWLLSRLSWREDH